MLDVAIENLGFSYSGSSNVVLDNINLNVKAGDFVCLLGQSGCGKSTLLRLIAGLETPDRGQVLVDGIPVKGAGAAERCSFSGLRFVPLDDCRPKYHHCFGICLSQDEQGRTKRIGSTLDEQCGDEGGIV